MAERMVRNLLALSSLVLLAAGTSGCGIGSGKDTGPVSLQGVGEFPRPPVLPMDRGLRQNPPGGEDQLRCSWQRQGQGGHPQEDRRFRGQRRGHDQRGDQPGRGGSAAAALDRRQRGAGVQPERLPRPEDLRDAYVGIFLGQVTRWNDPRLARTNPGVSLPDLPIRVVVRGDTSGTTFAFTTHLTPSARSGPPVWGSVPNRPGRLALPARALRASLPTSRTPLAQSVTWNTARPRPPSFR